MKNKNIDRKLTLTEKVFGTHSDRELKKIYPIVDKIEKLRPNMMKMSDAELKEQTKKFKERLNNGESLDDILPEAFATVREASRRVLDMEHYPVQLIGGVVLTQGRVAEMATGQGKSVPLNTPIPTPNGWRTAGDIKIGDNLFSRIGKPTKVIGVYPQGKIDTYEITLRDGRKIKCAEDHLWEAYDKYTAKNTRTINTKEMFEKGALKERGYNFFLPTSKAVEYEYKDFKIDPYVLGCFLGNGCKTKQGNLEISSSDEENVKLIAELIGAKDYIKKKSGYSWSFYKRKYVEEFRNDKIKAKDLDQNLEDLLVNTYCFNKYIPEDYKTSSIEQRWALIQGLMDTDGNIYNGENSRRYNLQFSTTSEKLRDDFMEVVYSLGCSCSYKLSRKAGVRAAKHDQYTIYINVPNEIKHKFFRLKRKKDLAIEAENFKRRKNYDRIAIVNIEKLEEKTEQVCFAVDNDEHLFLVGQYVVTHNTLVSTCPAYVNALLGKGVHIVTVNDYLAKRDAEWMGKIHEFLGLSVGVVLNSMNAFERKKAYDCDITYVTNNELGFDYLRDNMAVSKNEMVLRGLNYCIIDEVDSILIDEARTPLIISGESGKSTRIYELCDMLAKRLKRGEETEFNKFESIMGEEMKETGDFVMNEKDKTVHLTEQGVSRVEQYFRIKNLADPENMEIQHCMTLALRANYMMFRDQDYVVKDGEVLIVDEFTGRIMHGRRYSDGLHQAVEAKEKLKVRKESKTLATITFQNFFNKYEKKAGMTGTAQTEEKEFRNIYGMDVVVIPTHQPVIRNDKNDIVYNTKKEKYNAIINEIVETNKTGQPVLVGTITIETSELLSSMLKKRGIKHNVLNAKQHEKEAEIVADAGKAYAVTIATNMAGRGTDIKLDEKARECGGLKIIGTERHESRRIDNQLRGRSGRQGDPGESKFYLSLEDDLMRLFGSEKLIEVFKSLGIPENEQIEHKFLSSTIEKAQKKIESNNYGIRENVLKYDEVMNEQRELIYEERMQIVNDEDMREVVIKMISDVIEDNVDLIIGDEKDCEKWDLNKLNDEITSIIPIEKIKNEDIDKNFKVNNLKHLLKEKSIKFYETKEAEIGNAEKMREIERLVLLKVIDSKWMTHIDDMDHLKQGIGLQAYGQKDPLVEYKMAAYEMFNNMANSIREDAIRILCHMEMTN